MSVLIEYRYAALPVMVHDWLVVHPGDDCLGKRTPYIIHAVRNMCTDLKSQSFIYFGFLVAGEEIEST